MIQAVLFNIDGVICDTDEYHYRSWKAVSEDEGIPFDRSLYNQMRGTSRLDCVELMVKRSNKNYNEEQKQALADKKNEIYRNFLSQMSEVDCAPEVRSTLDWLKKNGIRIGIATASTNCEAILRRVKMENVFDVLVDGTMVKRVEHDPTLFDLATQKLGLPKESILVVEDGQSGIQAAKKGGYKTAGVKEASSYYQTDYPLRSIVDLIPVIEKLNAMKL